MVAPQAMGVISIGSNDIHLLAASSDGMTSFHQEISHSALAELVGTLQANVLPVAALGRALQDLDTLVTMARSVKAHPILAVGTEALREARNGPAFLELAAKTLGIDAFTITGEEEAALDYRWATYPFPPDILSPENKNTEIDSQPEQDRASASVLAIDSGGGSTQVVLGTGPGTTFSRSLPIGAGNLTQQWIAHDPPKRAEMQALRDHVSSLVDRLPSPPSPPQHVVAMGGSADHLVQFSAHRKRSLLTVAALDQMLAVLQKKTAPEIAHKFELPVERARLLPAGAVILQALLRHYGSEEALVKENGIRGAVVVSYARDGNRWRQGLASLTPLTLGTSSSKSKRQQTPKKN